MLLFKKIRTASSLRPSYITSPAAAEQVLRILGRIEWPGTLIKNGCYNPIFLDPSPRREEKNIYGLMGPLLDPCSRKLRGQAKDRPWATMQLRHRGRKIRNHNKSITGTLTYAGDIVALAFLFQAMLRNKLKH